MKKVVYQRPQIYRVRLEPEQAVLACCVIGSVTAKRTGTTFCGAVDPSCVHGDPPAASSAAS